MGQPLKRANTNYQVLPTPEDQITIEVATTKKEKEKVYRLRYQIYVKEMGKKLSNVDHRRRLLYDDMDDWGILFYARAGSEVVGTLHLQIGYEDNFLPELVQPLAMDKFQEFRSSNGLQHQLAFGSKGMVAPQYRNSQIHSMLTTAFYEACRRQGVQFYFGGCAPSIVAMHERLGARRYKSNFFVPDYGCMVPLVNLLEDVEHLQRVNSPLLHIAERWPNSPDSAEWFARAFPEAPHRHINKHLISKDEHWDILAEKLVRPPEKAIGLFYGLSETEARLCAYAGHLVYCEQADTIVYPEDMSSEFFVVISGSVAVRKDFAKRRQAPVILQPGQAFGEKTFIAHDRQKATVIAQTDTELLVFPSHGVERLQRQHPEIAAKLLHNMGAQAARRYA
jgi:hypothetical protein